MRLKDVMDDRQAVFGGVRAALERMGMVVQVCESVGIDSRLCMQCDRRRRWRRQSSRCVAAS